jgi:hypothetical protein
MIQTRPSRYRDITDFITQHRPTLPKRRDPNLKWRLCEETLGEIRALPHLRGWLVATNGVDAFLLVNNEPILILHENFIPDQVLTITFKKTKTASGETIAIDNVADLIKDILG